MKLTILRKLCTAHICPNEECVFGRERQETPLQLVVFLISCGRVPLARQREIAHGRINVVVRPFFTVHLELLKEELI